MGSVTMSSSAGRWTEGCGKGDRLRKVNKKKFDENFDRIFNKTKQEKKDEASKQTKTLDSRQG